MRKAAERARESPIMREERLKRNREQMAAARGFETQAESQARQQKDKERRAVARRNEAQAVREERLKKDREQKADVRERVLLPKEAKKSEWTLAKERGGSAFREFEGNKQKERLSRETPEQREVRLQKMREYSASRRANKTIKISFKVREATRERVAALRAKRTPEEVQLDRERAREGIARMNERRSAYTDEEWEAFRKEQWKKQGPLGERRGKHHHDHTCDVRMWRLKVAAGTEAGPEPLNPNGKPRYCHHCDHDQELPLAGEGRCWKKGCYSCAVLFGREEKWCKERNIPFKKKDA